MPKQGSGIGVIVEHGKWESAYRKFKNQIKKYGLMQLLSEKEYFEKPSMKKRKKKISQKIRNKKNKIEE